MKTRQLSKFYTNISILNNKYAHYLFVWEQFNIDNKGSFINHSDELTTDLFKENKNSKQFNVKIKHLMESHESTQNFILESLFTLSYSFFEKYIEELSKFEKSLKQEDYNKIKMERLLEELNINTFFSNEEKVTLDYIRLRRNKIIHDAENTQKILKDIIVRNGKKLNDYWNDELRKGRYEIDFNKQNISFFDKLEFFDLLNILRKISSKIDKLIIEKIGEKVLIKYIKKEFIEENSNKIKVLKETKIQKKFLGYCKSRYSYNIDVKILKQLDFMME